MDYDQSTPAFNATHYHHCVWKPCHHTVLSFHHDSACPYSHPCNDHNKGQDFSSHCSLPVDHCTLQAFYLCNPFKWEVTYLLCCREDHKGQMETVAMALSSTARRDRCSSMSKNVPWKLRVYAKAYTTMPWLAKECPVIKLGVGSG